MMNKFGLLKSKILYKLTESYTKEDKSEIRDILKIIKEDKNFIELFLFYDEFEKKYFSDKNIAKDYIDEVAKTLNEQYEKSEDTINLLSEKLKTVEVRENVLYQNLDNLMESYNLNSIDKKILSKVTLVNHLMTEKSEPITENKRFTLNQKFLFNVLTQNFNSLYENTLNEEEKEELKTILSLNNYEISEKVNQLKEEILIKLNSELQLDENKQHPELSKKLQESVNVVESMNSSKHSYYKLLSLKNTFK